eukprot:TRINITY_DN12354_c0_g1_i1.p1 TRINITY_DN12354_c0_g1~~TRINITY_DN12354_c0_g1_i1.p1  ORF type:complete len:646 (+),score=167.15 TRINITY_DN12354_c0_g1_i1:54-1991(+)
MAKSKNKRTRKYAPKLKNEIERKKREKYRNQKKRKRDELTQDDSSYQPQDEDLTDQNEIKAHMDDIENLKESQKEFFEFLEAEGSNLLDFGLDQFSSSEEDEEPLEDTVLTLEIFDKWCEELLSKPTLKTIRLMLGAFRVACHVNDPEEDDYKFKYDILDGELFNAITMFCLEFMGSVFDILLEKNPEDEHYIPNRSKRWKNTKKYVKSYLTNLLHFLGNLTEPKMIGFVLKQTQLCVEYFGTIPKLCRTFLKKLLKLWGGSSATVRVLAFFNILDMAKKVPYPFLNDCLKGMYLTFVKNAKFVNPKTLPLVDFLGNCVVEIFGIDFNMTYQHAFVYIRQIAVHLRESYHKKSKSAYNAIYNWQTFNSIRVWVKILNRYPNQEDLQLLIYPIVQILQGMIALIPTPRYYPFRLKAIKLLNELSSVYPNLYINSANYLLEMVTSPSFQKKPKPYTGKPMKLPLTLKANEQILGTKSYQNTILDESFILLVEYFAGYSYAIAFPELVLPALLRLKKYIKQCRNPYLRRRFSTLVDKINLNSKYILSKRNNVNFGPADSDQVNAFLSEDRKVSPLSAYARKILAEADDHWGAGLEEVKPAPKKNEPEPEEPEPKRRKVEESSSSEEQSDDEEVDRVEDFVLSDSEESE